MAAVLVVVLAAGSVALRSGAAPTAVKVGVTVGGPGGVTSSPAGIDCRASGGTCSAAFPAWSTVTLSAKSDGPGSHLDSWSGGCRGSGLVCTVVADQPVSVHAVFQAGAPPQPALGTLFVTRAGGGKVTSSPAGTIDCGQSCSRNVGAGSSTTLVATPDEGWRFVHWTGSGCGGASTCTVRVSGKTSVAATFGPVVPPPGGSRFTLTVQNLAPGSGDSVSVSTPDGRKTCAAGHTCRLGNLRGGDNVVLTGLEHPTFRWRWSGACVGEGPACGLVIDADRTVGAARPPIPFETSFGVNVSASGPGVVTSVPSGIDCGSRCSAGFGKDDTIRLHAETSANYRFRGWSGDCSGTSADCTTKMDSPKSVSAAFARQSWQLMVRAQGGGTGTIESSPAGIGCGGACTATFVAGTTVKLRATAAQGSQFAGWSGDCSGSGGCSVTIDANKTVVATFQPVLYRLVVLERGDGAGRVESSPTGILCRATCSAPFAFGTVVTLRAAAAQGSRFAGWSGDCSGTGNCALRMDGPKRVMARFERLQFLLVVSKRGSGTGTVASSPPGISCGGACSRPFAFGSVVRLSATAAKRSRFVGWSGGCSGAGRCVLTMSGPRSVKATFARLKPPLAVQALRVSVTSHPRRITVHFRLKGSASARLRLLRRTTKLAQATVSLRAGSHAVVLAVPAKIPGGRYRLELAFRDSAGTLRYTRSLQVDVPALAR